MEKYGKGKTGPDYFRSTVGLFHATYIGYHGFADQWLADNPELTVEMLNRCSYWYFRDGLKLPDVLRPGQTQTIQIIVPGTLKVGTYTLKLKLHSEQADRDVFLTLDRELLDHNNFYKIASIRCSGAP